MLMDLSRHVAKWELCQAAVFLLIFCLAVLATLLFISRIASITTETPYEKIVPPLVLVKALVIV